MNAKPLRGLVRAWVWAVTIAAVVSASSAHAQQDGSVRPGWELGFNTEGLIESAPAIGPDGTIYVTTNTRTTASRGRLFAVRPDGSTKWPQRYFEAEAEITASPVLSADGRTIYFGAWDGKFYAIDAATGRKKWHFILDVDVPTVIVNGSAAIGEDGTIYFGSSDLDITRPGALHRVAEEETHARELRRVRVAGAVETTPAIGPDGTIYFAAFEPVPPGSTNVGPSRVYAMHPETLETNWSVPTTGPVHSSPAIGPDGTVYVSAYLNGVFAITPGGATKWIYSAAGSVYATPTLGADGTIYFGSVSEWKFFAVNPDGSEKWTFDFGDAAHTFSTAAVRADGTIIFAVNRERSRSQVYALNPDRTQKWLQNRNDLIYSSPAIAPDGTIYIGANDRRLHSFHGSGSPISTVSSWPMFGRDITHTSRATPPTDSRLLNLSTRAAVGPGAELITGFAVRGDVTKGYLIRGIGPSLTAFGVSNPVADPTITLRAFPSNQVLAFNDDWHELPPPNPSITQTGASVGAFPLPQGSKDAVVLPSLAPGLYTAEIGVNDGGPGTALVEAYDAPPDEPNAALINLSTRMHVGFEPLIVGFVIRGTRPLRVLVRAVGPGLVQHGVSGVLQRPVLRVFAREQQIERLIAANTNWTTSPLRADVAAAAALSGAFALATNSQDSATVLSLSPGSNAPGEFTIHVSSADGATGVALVEIYVIP